MKRLEIGVAADRSLSTIFEPLIVSLARATDALNKFEGKVKSGVKGATDTAGAEANKMAAQAAKAFAQMEAASAKAAAKEIADADKAAQSKERALQREFDRRLRLAKQAADAEEREIMRTAKAAENAEQRKFVAAQRADKSAREQRAVSVGRDAYQTFGGVARAGIGIAGDVARGAGVNFDLSSYVGKAVSAETKATNIVNQAAMSGQDMGPDAAKQMVARARGVADAAKVDANATLDVLGAFQAKSSDLKTGEDVLERLAKLAKVSGTSFADMGTAAGAINAQLADTPDRAERLVAIMAHLTKQTADGSVEMSDYSKYVGVIAASANAYSGSFDKNIGQLGALSQMSMKGGAYTAAMATGAAASFAKDVTKDKTLKKWTGAGIDVFQDEGHTKLKDVEELIVAYTKVKGADRAELAKFFPNVVSKRAVESSLDTYQKAGGGAAGEAAIREEFAKFRATLSPEKIAAMYETQKDTAANKVVDFNNQLERIAASLTERVLPAMEQLAPKVVEVVDALGRVIGWAAENPGTAIVTAIVASIGKAAIGNMVGTALENALKSAGAAAGGGGLGLAVGAATIGIAVGSILVSKLQEETAKGGEAARGQVAVNEAVLTKAEKEFKETGTLSPETIADLQRQKGVVEGQIKEGASAPSAESTKGLGGIPVFLKDMLGIESYEQLGKKQGARDAMGQLTGESKGIDALLAAVNGLRGDTVANKPPKSVTVDNMPGGPIAGGGTSNTGAPVLMPTR